MQDLLQEFKYLFLLSTCTEELMFTPKIITFLPNPEATENVPLLSNRIPSRKSVLINSSIFYKFNCTKQRIF